MMLPSKVTPAIAGKYLGVDPQTVRYWLQDGVVDFGIARRNKDRYSYYISAEKLRKFKGEMKDE